MPHSDPAGQGIAFRARDRVEMEAKLLNGLAVLQERAQIVPARGILVIRHSPWDFTLELDADVPYGVIQERDDWQRLGVVAASPAPAGRAAQGV